MKRLRVDANVLLRFLTGEPEDLAQRSALLMRSAEAGDVLLVLSSLVIAESSRWRDRLHLRCKGF